MGLRTSDPIHSSNPDGLIVQIHQKAGATADCTLPIVTIASLETLEGELYVPVQRHCTLKPGGQALLISSAPVNRDIAATVRSVSPVIDSASNIFRCVLIINNTDRILRGTEGLSAAGGDTACFSGTQHTRRAVT